MDKIKSGCFLNTFNMSISPHKMHALEELKQYGIIYYEKSNVNQLDEITNLNNEQKKYNIYCSLLKEQQLMQ